MSSVLSVVTLQSILRKFHDDRGAAAVSFILTFPLFLSVVAVVVQFALLANARIVVEQACHAAARSAQTSLPEGQPDNVHQAARLVLSQISPEAKSGAAPEAVTICSALRDCGAGVSPAYANRYTYAMSATDVSWAGAVGDYENSAAQEVEVTVRYRFQLTVPVANAMLAKSTGNVAGINGRFYELVSTRRVLSSPGRKVRAAGDGWPLQ